MSSTFFKDLYEQVETGVARASVPAGSYNVAVSEARVNAKNGSQIFLTFTVLDGPDAGKAPEVSLYFPKEGDKSGAVRFFITKTAGLLAYADVKAAFQAADNAPDRVAGLQHIADTLIGKQVQVELILVKEGDYAGTNELRSTKPLAGFQTPAPAPQFQAPTPAPAPAPAPQPQFASADDGKAPF